MSSQKRTDRVGPRTRKRVEHYALNEPSFTVPFAAWELKLSQSAVSSVIAPMVKSGKLEEIEPRSGPYAATYSRKKRQREMRLSMTVLRTNPRELVDRRVAWATASPK